MNSVCFDPIVDLVNTSLHREVEDKFDLFKGTIKSNRVSNNCSMKQARGGVSSVYVDMLTTTRRCSLVCSVRSYVYGGILVG